MPGTRGRCSWMRTARSWRGQSPRQSDLKRRRRRGRARDARGANGVAPVGGRLVVPRSRFRKLAVRSLVPLGCHRRERSRPHAQHRQCGGACGNLVRSREGRARSHCLFDRAARVGGRHFQWCAVGGRPRARELGAVAGAEPRRARRLQADGMPRSGRRRRRASCGVWCGGSSLATNRGSSIARAATSMP